MRLHTEQHQQYCGIDLRTNKIYLCILNQEGALLPCRKTNTEPELFLQTIAPLGRVWSSALRACFHGTGDRHPKNYGLAPRRPDSLGLRLSATHAGRGNPFTPQPNTLLNSTTVACTQIPIPNYPNQEPGQLLAIFLALKSQLQTIVH